MGRIAERAVHSLVSTNNRVAHFPSRNGPADQVPGPVFGDRQPVPVYRGERRVLFYIMGRRTRPAQARGARQAGGLAGDPLVAVHRQHAMFNGRRRDGKTLSSIWSHPFATKFRTA